MIERRSTEMRQARPDRGKIIGLMLSLCLLWIGMGTGFAASGFPPAFVVTDVPVDVTAKGDVSPRDAARAQGQAAAMTRLLQRLTGPSDWPRLPVLDQQTITGLLSDYEVLDEHSSAARYIGSYTFRFNRNGVRQILNNTGLPFSELASKPVVIVPMLQFADPAATRPDPDPWRDAWSHIPGKYGIVPWVVPPSEQQEPSLDDPANTSPNPDVIRALSQRFDDGDVVIVKATQSANGDNVHLDINIAHYAVDGSVQTAATAVDGPKAASSLYHAAVAAVVVELENQWKTISLVSARTPPSSVAVVVPISRAADWGMIRDRLGRVPVIKSASVEAMTRHDMRLTLMVTADPATLKVALAQQNLILNADGDVATLTLRSPDRASAGNP